MKNKFRLILIIILSAIVYTVAYFVIPFPHKSLPIYICVYVFTMFSFVAQLYTTKDTFLKKNSPKSKIYGLPVIKVGIIYLIASLIFMLLMTILNAFIEIPLWIYIIVQLIIIILGIIGVLITEGVKTEIKNQESKIKKQTKFMNELKIDIKVLADSFDYQPLKQSINDLKELIVYSDPVENKETVSIDKEIKQNYDFFKDSISNRNYEETSKYIKKITDLVNDRNLKNKLNK